VIVGPSGGYTIETKFRSKPPQGATEIQYDGEKLEIEGFTDTETIGQAKAQRDWRSGLLKQLTGRSLRIRPVVIFPGRSISRQPKGIEVWVLNESALPAVIDHEPRA